MFHSIICVEFLFVTIMYTFSTDSVLPIFQYVECKNIPERDASVPRDLYDECISVQFLSDDSTDILLLRYDPYDSTMMTGRFEAQSTVSATVLLKEEDNKVAFTVSLHF